MMKFFALLALFSLGILATSQVQGNCAADCERFGLMLTELSQHAFPGAEADAKHADKELCSRMATAAFQTGCLQAVEHYGLKNVQSMMSSSPGSVCSLLQCANTQAAHEMAFIETQPGFSGDMESWPEQALTNENPEMNAVEEEEAMMAAAAQNSAPMYQPQPGPAPMMMAGPDAAQMPEALTPEAGAPLKPIAPQENFLAQTSQNRPMHTAVEPPHDQPPHWHAIWGQKAYPEPCASLNSADCKPTPKPHIPAPGNKDEARKAKQPAKPPIPSEENDEADEGKRANIKGSDVLMQKDKSGSIGLHAAAIAERANRKLREFEAADRVAAEAQTAPQLAHPNSDISSDDDSENTGITALGEGAEIAPKGAKVHDAGVPKVKKANVFLDEGVQLAKKKQSVNADPYTVGKAKSAGKRVSASDPEAALTAIAEEDGLTVQQKA